MDGLPVFHVHENLQHNEKTWWEGSYDCTDDQQDFYNVV